eukprot:c16140_g1_i1.p1 GENE.c16140_g1_i1~~c16140_g1_i1.p1  ORF type:complete len:252 (-),score=40.29 c16140_g1_i1:4-759(-)
MVDFRHLKARLKEEQALKRNEPATCDRDLKFHIASLSPQSLDFLACQVGRNLLQDIFYVPDFLSHQEETQLVALIDAAAQKRWIQGNHRRMCNFGGKPAFSNVTEPLPQFLQVLVDQLVACGVFDASTAPNHILVNDYDQIGGILPHRDGEMYFPRVAVLSLLGQARLDFRHSETDQNAFASVFLQPRSLHVVSANAYNNCFHSIDQAQVDVISSNCINTHIAGLNEGESLGRTPRRISVVCVHKLGRENE